MTQRLFLVSIVVALAIAALWLARTPEPAPPQQVGPDDATEHASPSVPPVQAPVAAPTVREDAPRNTVAAPTEPTRDGLDEMLRRLDPGELEVLVIRGAQPVAGASVRVWPRGTNRLGNAKGRGTAIRTGSTDTTGRVRFQSLAPDDVVVRADHDGRWLEAGGKVIAEPSAIARTVVLAFGSATIVGSVRDDSGEPRGGVPVYVVGLIPNCAVVTGTDEEGRFEVSGLYGGRYHVQLDQAPEQWSPAYERMLTLQPGERARMDLGGPPPAGSLCGRVVDAEGNVVHGERALRLRQVAHNDERRVRAGANGEFAIALPPGRWEVFGDLLDAPFEAQVLAAADVDRTEVRADVVWPGIRLLALVTAPPDVTPEKVRECLTLTGDQRRFQPDAAFVADERTIVQWTLLSEGPYMLQAGNGLQFPDAANTGVAVHVSAARVQRVFVNVQR